MKTMSRREALALNLKTYFTGVPCVNGHIAKRYVQSSTCSECLHPKKSQTIEELNAQILRVETYLNDLKFKRDNFSEPIVIDDSKRKTLSEFIKIKVIANVENLENIKSLILFTAIKHHPDIKIVDIWSNKKPTNRVIYEVLAHPSDRAELIKLTNSLFNDAGLLDRLKMNEMKWKEEHPDETFKM